MLTIDIHQPTAGTEVGDSIFVSGTLSVSGGITERVIKKVLFLTVSVNDGGPSVSATRNGASFTCTRPVKAGTPGGTPLTVTVYAQVLVPDDADKETHEAQIEATVEVPVVYGQRPPVLTVQVPQSVTSPAPFLVTGTATDDVAGIASVQYSIDGGAFAAVDDVSGTWSRWAQTLILDPGAYQLTVRATGGPPHALVTEQTLLIEVLAPFTPADIDQVFEPTTYLRELLDFTRRQARIGAAATGPTPDQLSQIFFQPFAGLISSTNFEQATAPVSQARIAVEVLRRLLPAAATVDADGSARSRVYRAILTQLGTSYDELRLSRLNGPDGGAGLAARLGITPDQLTQLIISDAAITDAQLEELFGYRSTAPADPLQPASAPPLVLTWQSATLWDAWKAEDHQERTVSDPPSPLIDPDLVDRAALRGQPGMAASIGLWTDRAAWIANTLAQIRATGQGMTDPLARFDLVMGTFLATLDLPGLASRDAAGEDIGADLRSSHLDLAGFRFLAAARSLLTAGADLGSEWDDVSAIVLQATKRAQYADWRAQEETAGVVAEPGQFDLDGLDPTREIPAWRGTATSVFQLRRTVRARANQLQTLSTAYHTALDAAEDQTLPGLRDALLDLIGAGQPPPEDRGSTAERLTRQLIIDLLAAAGTRTTRTDQALETLQGVLFATRAGRMTTGTDDWQIAGSSFDAQWAWMGNYDTWLAAIRLFAYPENLLNPGLYLPDGLHLSPTVAFAGGATPSNQVLSGFLTDLRKATTFSPQDARAIAATYLTNLRAVDDSAKTALTDTFVISDQLTDSQRAERTKVLHALFSNLTFPIPSAVWVHEVFWLVPTAIALRLQEEREYLAALDWFQTIYAFTQPESDRPQYPLLAIEASVTSVYERDPDLWLTLELNPHVIAWPRQATIHAPRTGRRHVHTRSTILSIAQCLLAYADLEFSRTLPEAVTRARTLYQTAADLLDVPELTPETGLDVPFPPNPIWDALRSHARTNLDKIHNGLNIAGIKVDPGRPGARVSLLPSQYRYSVLIERAKNLTGVAQQVESAYLQALERRDTENYNLFQADHDLQVAAAQVTIADLKVADAGLQTVEAELQKGRADIQFDHFDQLISDGLNGWELATIGAMTDAVLIDTAAIFDPLAIAKGGPEAAAAQAASAAATLTGTLAGYERRSQDWQLARQVAQQDQLIGAVQIAHARDQQQIAQQERALTGLQLDHASATVTYLAHKFTSAELFDWMSGVLGHAYAYFLQQATSIALLAQAQLAFERQEPPAAVIRSDYWQDTTGAPVTGPDRQGLTGSVRLLEDLTRLDQLAFETDQRKLHLTTTLSLADIAATELQGCRETGVLIFTTPADLFDQDFPGDYLRLVKSVKVTINALTTSRGVRGTLSASGLSRVIVPGDSYTTAVIVRPPDSISLSSPLNATGLFEAEPDTGMLLPFEGMGVDTTWRLELPKPANPFDFRSIADVLLTINYTALHDPDLREQVLREQDRQFSGDRAFSIRLQYPDAWYDLNNPDTVEPASNRMQATLNVTKDDFPTHLSDLAVEQVTLFCLRADGVTEELRVLSLAHAMPGVPVTNTPEVRTLGGIVSTRRPGGVAWQPLVGQNPTGDWTIQLENTDQVNASFQDGSIQDIVLILTFAGTTPPWP